MEERGKIQIVQLAWTQADRLSDQQRDLGCAATMASLPGERAIDFLTDLANENAFDVAV